MPANPEEKLRRLDVTMIVAASKKRLEKVKAFDLPSKGPMLAHATLPSEYSHAPYQLYFHVDLESPRKDPYLTIHLHFAARSSVKRETAATRKLRAENKTVEWLLRELDGLQDKAIGLLFVDAELALSKAEFGMPQQGILAPPLPAGAAVLEFCGAEYRRETRSGIRNPLAEGIQKFRWKDAPNGILRTWLSYVVKRSPDSQDFWSEEQERCLNFAKELLS